WEAAAATLNDKSPSSWIKILKAKLMAQECNVYIHEKSWLQAGHLPSSSAQISDKLSWIDHWQLDEYTSAWREEGGGPAWSSTVQVQRLSSPGSLFALRVTALQ
ncbi:unnamed protein product, partial [Urochloa humidicola]